MIPLAEAALEDVCAGALEELVGAEPEPDEPADPVDEGLMEGCELRVCTLSPVALVQEKFAVGAEVLSVRSAHCGGQGQSPRGYTSGISRARAPGTARRRRRRT